MQTAQAQNRSQEEEEEEEEIREAIAASLTASGGQIEQNQPP
jgi:hypothetical protein